MANYVESVAKMLNVKMDEVFEINEEPVSIKYRFDSQQHKLMRIWPDNSTTIATDDLIANLVYGKCTIKHKPQKPKFNTPYWGIDPTGNVSAHTWIDSWFDINNYKLGNVYNTVWEADANREKWIAFYASDDVLGGVNYGKFT